MSAATPFLTFSIGLLLGIIAGGLAATAWYRRSAPPPPPATPPPPAAPDLRPIIQSLQSLHDQIGEIEKDQAVASTALASQVQAIGRSSARMGDRTDQLLNALRSPQVRGRWGEMQLERVVELGGMLEHVDFEVQAHMVSEGSSLRPDLVVRLSQGRNIIVDAKVPLSSFLDALNTEDPEEKQGYLRRHAHLLRNHINTLSSRSYTAAFQPSPEFVVLFVPADPFLDAALKIDPELMDYAFSRDVIIATPGTLFALLRTVALTWRHDSLNEKTREIQRLGAQLYQRLEVMAEHYNKVGTSLERAVEAFNATLASVDSRVMVTARRLAEMEVPAQSHERNSRARLHPIAAQPRRSTNFHGHGTNGA